MARYEAGETLASIARTYDCSPPAISYVVSRSRTRQPGAATPTPVTATAAQLVKTAAGDPPANGNGQSPLPAAPRLNGQAHEATPPREGNGFDHHTPGEPGPNPAALAPRAAPPMPRPMASPTQPRPANGDHRRTLHLSLGNTAPGNGATHPAEHHPAERHNVAGDRYQAPPQASEERIAAPPDPRSPDNFVAPDREHDLAPATGFSAPRPAAYNTPAPRSDADLTQRRDGAGTYIDKDLRARVDGDIAAFLAAFDAALMGDTQESRSALREATDRLLRAGARTRIELERLEARMPLPPRDNSGRAEAWRHR